MEKRYLQNIAQIESMNKKNRLKFNHNKCK